MTSHALTRSGLHRSAKIAAKQENARRIELFAFVVFCIGVVVTFSLMYGGYGS